MRAGSDLFSGAHSRSAGEVSWAERRESDFLRLIRRTYKSNQWLHLAVSTHTQYRFIAGRELNLEKAGKKQKMGGVLEDTAREGSLHPRAGPLSNSKL